MAVRSFNWNDLPALLDFFGDLKSRPGPGRELRLETFQEVLRQPWLRAEENCFLLEEGGQVRGYCLVVPELAIGRAVLEMEVAPALAGGPAERELLLVALERARAMGAGVLHHAVTPGSHRAGLLEGQGFALVRVYWNMLWQGDPLPDASPGDGFTVRRYKPGDAPVLTDIQNSSFAGSWGFCPNTVEQIEYRSAMSNTSHEGIRLLYDGEAVAGYCWTTLAPLDGHTRGMISMIGVAPEYRGRGIGKTLLLSGMEFLWKAGVADIGLQVDANNAPAIRLYRSVGFWKDSEMHWFEFKTGEGPPC